MSKSLSIEQEKIILATQSDRHISISAFAGSGKSSTLIEVTRFNPQEKILYLVYNKAMQEEFADRMSKNNIKNCEIKTIHSLAFQWYIKTHGYKTPKSVSTLDVINLLQASQVNNDDDYDEELEEGEIETEYSYATKLDFELKRFMSSDMEIKDFVKTLKKDKIKKDIKAIWSMLTQSKTIDHNVYLKLYQLSKPKLNYSMILVDEFQDCTNALISVLLNNLDKKIVVCGDKYQSINNFNHTVNGLEILEDKHNFSPYSLTQSFRTSNAVAEVSSKFLSWSYDRDINFTGASNTVICKLDINKATTKDKMTVLCRNRMTGLKYIMENIIDKDINKKVYLEGGIEKWVSEVDNMLKYHNVNVSGKTYSINKLRKMVGQGLEDSEVIKAISMYDFFNKHPLNALRAICVKYRTQAEITINTMHSSKGSEYENVILLDDIASPVFTKLRLREIEDYYSHKANLIKAEFNLLYVALTRAMEKLDIGFLDLNIESMQESYDRILKIIEEKEKKERE